MYGVSTIWPFPKSHNCKYILVAVDYVSKWVEALPCRATDAKHARKIFHEIIFPRFGTPRIKSVTEDRISSIRYSGTLSRNSRLSITLQPPTILRLAVKQKCPISRLRIFCKRSLMRLEGHGGTSCQTLYGLTIQRTRLPLVCHPTRSSMGKHVTYS